MATRIVCTLLVYLLVGVAVQAEPVKIDDAINPRGMISASISPDGRNIAAVIYNGTNYRLVLIDTSTLESRKLLDGRYGQTRFYHYVKAPRSVTWVGSETMAVDYGMEAGAVDLAGRQIRSLGERIIGPAERGEKESTRVLVYRDVDEGDIAICDARAGNCSGFSYPKGKPLQWAFDKKGKLRAVTLVNSQFWHDVSTVSNWYKPEGEAEWIKLAEFSITDDYWVPLYVPDEPDTLVIRSRTGRDTYALFNYDVKKRQQGEMLAGHPTQDILSYDGIDQGAFDYVATGGAIPSQVWFDASWAQMQKLVDSLLPNRINNLDGDPKRHLLIRSYGDVDPGTWYFFDVQRKRLVEIGRVNVSVKPEQMLHTEVVSYKAPDGLEIPAYLTRPSPTTRSAPAVVLIHGGPRDRDTWGWNAEVQLLASRGYVVLQPQFRGSTGFGRKFEEAGYGQWGRAMQDDVTAGVRYLIDKGIVDPKRICIVGASYGGYAALWGLVKTPDLYRCGVSFAGVSDIGSMFSDLSDRSLNKVTREIMLRRIGDKKMSDQLFDPVSPLKHASAIKVPVLLFHGEDDERVPISHSERMKRAMEENDKDVQLIVFAHEGHGLSYTKNERRYFTELLEFLEKHIGH
jgi:dipeptidyl aminopeptidase/acylaminoacyl peptidase